ncbi:MAG: hypothetical protein SNJ74_10755 [Fimbriimonadaceae bacterium]
MPESPTPVVKPNPPIPRLSRHPAVWAMVALALAGAWLAGAAGNRQVSSGLAIQRQAAAQAGLVLDLGDIPRTTVDAEADAAPALAQIRASWPALAANVDRSFWPLARALSEGFVDAPALEAFRRTRPRLQELFTLFDVAASRADLLPSWDGGEPLRPAETLLPMAAEVLLVADFRYQEAVGDRDAADRAVRRVVRLARLIGRDDTASAAIQSARLESAVLRAWADAVRANPNEATLGLLRALRDGEERLDQLPVPSIRRVLTIEAALGARELRQTPRPGAPSVEDTSPSWYSVLEARYWMTWRGVFRRLPEDPLDLAAAKRALQRESESVRGAGVLYRMAFERRSVQWVPMAEAVGLLAADRGLAEAYAVLVRRSLAGERVPDALAELGLELRDPFAPAPIRLRPTDDGFVVFSVGPDLMNDGGEPAPASIAGPQRSDRVLRFP